MRWLLPITIAVLILSVFGPDSIAVAYDSTVYEAQKRLKERGYNPGPVDGLIGRRTRDAIRKFQEANRISVTGKLDNSTKKELGILTLTPAPAYVPLGGNIWAGEKVYYGAGHNKSYGFEILGGAENCPSMPSCSGAKTSSRLRKNIASAQRTLRANSTAVALTFRVNRLTFPCEQLKNIRASSHSVRMDESLAPLQPGRGTGATIAVPHGL